MVLMKRQTYVPMKQNMISWQKC